MQICHIFCKPIFHFFIKQQTTPILFRLKQTFTKNINTKLKAGKFSFINADYRVSQFFLISFFLSLLSLSSFSLRFVDSNLMQNMKEKFKICLITSCVFVKKMSSLSISVCLYIFVAHAKAIRIRRSSLMVKFITCNNFNSIPLGFYSDFACQTIIGTFIIYEMSHAFN